MELLELKHHLVLHRGLRLAESRGSSFKWPTASYDWMCSPVWDSGGQDARNCEFCFQTCLSTKTVAAIQMWEWEEAGRRTWTETLPRPQFDKVQKYYCCFSCKIVPPLKLWVYAFLILHQDLKKDHFQPKPVRTQMHKALPCNLLLVKSSVGEKIEILQCYKSL